MSDQENKIPAAAASLEKLEQRFPVLADLLTRRASRSQTAKPASPESSAMKYADDLSQEEQKVMEKWLQSHYDRLAKKLSRLDPNFPV